MGGNGRCDEAGAGAVTGVLVRVARHGTAATRTLDSPHNRNAFPTPLVSEVPGAPAEAGAPSRPPLPLG